MQFYNAIACDKLPRMFVEDLSDSVSFFGYILKLASVQRLFDISYK